MSLVVKNSLILCCFVILYIMYIRRPDWRLQNYYSVLRCA